MNTFKKTKIGLIPCEWKVVELRDIGEVISGLTYKPQHVCEPDTGTLVLRSSNIVDGRISYGDNVFVDTSDLKFNPVQSKDILICVRNGSKALIGKNALIGTDSVGLAFGAFMSVFRSCQLPYNSPGLK